VRRATTALLVWVLLFPAVATAGTGGQARTQDPLTKLAPELAALASAAAPGEMIPAIVTLRDQADVGAITAETRGARLRAVVGALKRTSDETQQAVRDLLRARRAEGLVEEFTPLWVFNGLAVTATAEVLEELAARPEVDRITPDSSFEVETATAAGPPEPGVALVGAPALWDLGFRGQGIVVATMDTGVDATHPELASRWRGGSNSWFDPSGQHATPADVSGHGTWTMGVLVGGDAGGTSVGVAPDARWISVKIFDDQGVATTSGIHQGFQWLLDPDGDSTTPDAPNVVSNSWSIGVVGCSLEFQLDLQSLRAAGILPIFAAGNFGPGPSTSVSPANNPEAFAVGATDDADAPYDGSGRGPSACGEPATTYPELVAPGVDVRTTDLFGLYTEQTGTSLAAPHVAGALALLLDAYADIAVDEQEQALESGAVDLGPVGPDDEFGFGRLDVAGSYAWLAARPDFTVTATPSSATTSPAGGAAYTVEVASVGGFAGDVALSLAGLDPGQASWSFAPEVVVGGSGSSGLTITTDASIAPGTYPLSITGASGPTVHAAVVELVVVSPQDFTISVSPASRSVRPGGKASFTVTVASVGGFAGSVALTASGAPEGGTLVLRKTSVPAPGSTKLTVRTTQQTPLGTFTLVVTGQSGGLVHQATAELIVR
jgi:subtilisin family serine protease